MYSCFDCQRVLIINIWVSIESLYLWISDLRVAEESEIALWPHGSPFGGPGPHGDLFQFLDPHWVPISVLRSPFSLFRA